jgi:Amt family ammonium transporter
MLCNSVLAGLVSVTASCKNIELWAASLIGCIGSIIYYNSKRVISRYEIDDPLDITEVHGLCGIWSVIAVGIFDKDKGYFYSGNGDQLIL